MLTEFWCGDHLQNVYLEGRVHCNVIIHLFVCLFVTNWI